MVCDRDAELVPGTNVKFHRIGPTYGPAVEFVMRHNDGPDIAFNTDAPVCGFHLAGVVGAARRLA